MGGRALVRFPCAQVGADGVHGGEVLREQIGVADRDAEPFFSAFVLASADGRAVPRSGRPCPPCRLRSAKTSKTDRSKWSGAGLQTRSSVMSPAAAAAQSTNVSELRWEIITPFGVPVDPEV